MDLSNLPLIEEFYRSYLSDNQSVNVYWRRFFEGVDFASFLIHKEGGEIDHSALRIFGLIQAYRRFGHLRAHFNPLEEFSPLREEGELALERLGFSEGELRELFPTLGFCGKEKAPLQEIIGALEMIYCRSIGFEYMDLDSLEMEEWIKKQIEPELVIDLSFEEKKKLLESLNRSEIFETFIHTKYVGQKRFSLEGGETLIPLLAALLEQGSQLSMKEFVIGMAHRGRLNVLANILQKPYSMIFQEFEDNIPSSFGSGGDVKYHKGYFSEVGGLQLHLAANSSCLESVDSIVLGQTYARQILRGDIEKKQTGAILIHGDAALAGQGVVYESLQFCRLPGYATGGTVHIVINNQIGYTTLPEEGRSTRYCTDIAKTFNAPVFHVNAEDPESCIFIARLAMQMRQRFQCDVFIDLNCYRKYGHNEGDEPAFTQPLHYRSIRARSSIRQLYSEQLMDQGVLEKKLAETLESEFRTTLNDALHQAKTPSSIPPLPSLEKSLFVPTAVKEETLLFVAKKISEIPSDFHLHPKLEKWVQERLNMMQGNIDWGMGESLALATLLQEGIPVRLTGQDTARGTFSQRHAIWWDQETGKSHSPFEGLAVYNAPLSEFGSMAFEYGYSLADEKALVLWEAQYGDFVIGAEILIDHYLVAAEQKWGKHSSLTLLLPHGYEGGGPEHSSARIERFLQLGAHENMFIAYPTTPAQYFHLLRKQALSSIKKPLIVFTPKSLLRHPACVSRLSEFSQGAFQPVLEDPTPPAKPKKLILCSGKIYYDLLAAKEQFPDALLIRLEQLYPFPSLQKYRDISESFWVQEEPENMGPWEGIRDFLRSAFPDIIYNGRARSASTATGSLKIHNEEQKAILNRLKT